MADNQEPPSANPETGSSFADVMWFGGILWRGRRLMAVSVLGCLAAAVLYLFIATPQYRATASVLVQQRGGQPLHVPGSDPARPVEGTEDYIPTQVEVVSSPAVIQRAIDLVGLEDLPTLHRAKQKHLTPAQMAIKYQLKVSQPKRLAKVIRIEYLAQSREEAVRMTDAITRSYKKFLEDNYQGHSEAVSVLTRARAELLRELESSEQKYLAFRQQHPMLVPDEKGRSLVTGRLERWDRVTSDATVREVQLKAQGELVRNLSKEGTGLWAVVYALSQLNSDPNNGPGNGLMSYTASISQMTSWDYIRQLSLEQQQLAERYGPRYAKVKDIQEQIKRILERTRISRGKYEQVEMKDLLHSLEQSLKASTAMRAELNRGFEADKKLENEVMVEANLRTEVERRRTLFNGAVDQLKQAQLASDFTTIRAETIEPASADYSPSRPRWALSIGLACVVGLVGGGGGLVVRERAARGAGEGGGKVRTGEPSGRTEP